VGPNAAVVVLRGMSVSIRVEDVVLLVSRALGMSTDAVSRRDVFWGQDQTCFVRMPSIASVQALVEAARAPGAIAAQADGRRESSWLCEHAESLPSEWPAADALSLAEQSTPRRQERDYSSAPSAPWALDPLWREEAWVARDVEELNLCSFHVTSYGNYLRERPDLFGPECLREAAGADDTEPDVGTKRRRMSTS
jgi:hypothetical protein